MGFRKIDSIVVSVILALFLVGSFPQSANAAELVLVSPDVEDEIERLITEGNIPSLHGCIVSEDSIEWVGGFGEETDIDSPFLIGSIQKVFVAISIMQFYERGEIDLDSDVSEYLPFELKNPRYPNISITPRMLLSHRSGLESYLPYEFCYDWEGLPSSEYPIWYNQGVIDITLSEYLAECLTPEGQFSSSRNWLTWEPGTQYSYANSGFKLLMCLLEIVSGQSISDYMTENIFTPLRLNNTGFNATELDTPQAKSYTRINVTNIALPVWNGQYMIRSSISDMSHLLIALMNMGEFDGHQLLQSETVEMMLENTYSEDPAWDPGRELRWKGYGLGLDIFSPNLYGHGGSTIGYLAYSYFSPNLKKGYVQLSNVNSILDPIGDEWQEIVHYTNEIRNLVLTEAGMIPLISFIEIILITCSSIVLVSITYGILRRRKLKRKIREPKSVVM
ncbi:MAG: serine hydrolase [Candidatus Thorarchaeota archaeon]|nr:serine hydrolase [Candidatus Thorarchaeota archaeon]